MDVVYTEVGVVEIVATSATDSHGAGGNATESFTTQWFMYPTGTGPHGTQAISLPYECALCVTLQTDHRGPSGRGRFYFPPPYPDILAAGGRFNPGFVSEACTAFGAYIDAVKADHDLVPVVVSNRRLILNEITSLLGGSVPDSQRRRRRSQAEARVQYWSA